MSTRTVINRCAYCGGERRTPRPTCMGHADLPRLDPHYLGSRTAEIDRLIADILRDDERERAFDSRR